MYLSNTLFSVAIATLLHGSEAAVGTNDQVESNINFGSFQTPSSLVRPRFRYWANDASLNHTRLAEDVKAIGKAGAGGIELLGYYLYGDSANFGGQLASPLQTDWTVYGFGSPAWKSLADAALAAAKENNLVVDLATGPNQGAGVPAPYNQTGLLWDLSPFNETVPLGGTFDEILPGWGSGKLVAAVTGVAVNSTNSTTGSTVILRDSSLTDLTSKVGSDGRLKIQFPSDSGGLYNILFAYYLIQSHYREVQSPDEVQIAVTQSPITNYKQNGSFAVDHFSAAGAQVMIDFWNQELLDKNTKNLIAQAGNYLWEDSMEIAATIWWTPRLPSVFNSNRGYSVAKYIPLLISATSSVSKVSFATDEADKGASHLVDYKQTLTELYQEYLTTLTKWSRDLGIQYSAQVSYNLPMDMLASIPVVNAPECETLGFSNVIDSYRQFAGPANLAGKRVISNEGGGEMGTVYQQAISSLIWFLKRGFAGAVNNYVLHGFPYSGNYGNTTWPGFTTFAYIFAEMHGPRQPAFDFYSDFLNWVSRNQYILQSGVPKRDVVFWLKSVDTKPSVKYNYTDLQLAGYTWEYLSPDNFALPEAYVSDGLFAPNRQGFKAMVVNSTSKLTQSGVTKLVEYAKAGLPILFYGGFPSDYSGYNPCAAKWAASTVKTLAQYSNVHVVPAGGIGGALQSLNISPRTSVNANGTWYTVWREESKGSNVYVYIFNDMPATNLKGSATMTMGSITFETTGTPYLYDAWTGDITAISTYSQTNTHTTIPLQLAGNQTVIIGFHKQQTSDLHLQNTTRGILSTTGSSDSVTVYRSYDEDSRVVQLSNGKSRNLEPMAVPAFALSNWTLVVESWTPADDFYDVETRSRANSTFTIPSLASWRSISPALTNVSGRGYYSTSFTWPPARSSARDIGGAILDLGFITHTARVKFNGVELPPLDLTLPRSDIGSLLKTGTNSVEITVSTPLGNVLRSYWTTLKTSGKLATATRPAPPVLADYGLLAPVTVIPYRKDILQ
ncbi:hypothetical protein BX600DRAFT_484724 [Xylariales sp. PMI_506]|nr:hypothetical protein BX600DRAFT_484724 [Xylariales sp. PMI_506]